MIGRCEPKSIGDSSAMLVGDSQLPFVNDDSELVASGLLGFSSLLADVVVVVAVSSEDLLIFRWGELRNTQKTKLNTEILCRTEGFFWAIRKIEGFSLQSLPAKFHEIPRIVPKSRNLAVKSCKILRNPPKFREIP